MIFIVLAIAGKGCSTSFYLHQFPISKICLILLSSLSATPHPYPPLTIHIPHPTHTIHPESILPIYNSIHIFVGIGHPSMPVKNPPLVWNHQLSPESNPLCKKFRNQVFLIANRCYVSLVWNQKNPGPTNCSFEHR